MTGLGASLMEKNHHNEIIECMLDPAFYPHSTICVELRQTHISSVFLTGDFVYKVKKPVDLGFLNFSTLADRRHYCEQEIRLNRRLSREVYLEVLPITSDGTGYAIDGSGDTVEYAVKMRQLDDRNALAQQLKRGDFGRAEMDRLVNVLTNFYDRAATLSEVPAGIRPVEENFEVLQAFVGGYINGDVFEKVRTSTLEFYERRRNLFVRRVAQGKIRDGHGDLRTDHIYLTPDGIQIIDCLEFNESLRSQDIISDLAFLAIDLEENHAKSMADWLIRGYLEHSGDLNAVALLDFYRCYRAMVRCKVSCLRLQQLDPYTLPYKRHIAAAENYLAMAETYAAAFSRPLMWIVCGMPASGKSTIAAALAEVFDFRTLRSDRIRKKLFDRSETSGAHAAFEGGIYTTEATAITYDHMLSAAPQCLKNDQGVVLDATFSDAAWRKAAIRTAELAGATPVFVECQASPEVLSARLRQRDTEPSLSDARLEHLPDFVKHYTPFEGQPYADHRVVNTERPLQACLRAILLGNDQPPATGRNGGNHV